MQKDSHVKIIVKDMSVDVRIGLHPHEQEGERSQRIIVNVELFAKLGGYLEDVSRDSIIDYDHIYCGIKEWAARPHTLLIETYLNELLALCFRDERVQSCRVSVTKPDVFEEVEAAGVEVFVKREDWEK